MKFKSEANLPKPHEFAIGGFNKIIEKYEDLINSETGKLETKVTDREDFYEKIQSFKDSQTLDAIIKRYEIDIDKKQLTEIKEDIVDMTLVPKTFTEAYSIIKQVENEFDKRPAEIKKAFNNNVGEYVAGIQNGKLKQVVQEYENKNKKFKGPQGQTLEQLNKEIETKIINQTPIINQETINKMVKEQIEKSISIQGGNTNV